METLPEISKTFFAVQIINYRERTAIEMQSVVLLAAATVALALACKTPWQDCGESLHAVWTRAPLASSIVDLAIV